MVKRLCGIPMMICEIAIGDGTNGSGDDRLRNDDGCYFDRILSSPFRRLALGIIIIILLECILVYTSS